MDVADPQHSRRRWITYLLGTSLGAAFVSFLYPVLRYLVPPVSSEPSLSEIELDVKASDILPNSGRIVPFAGKPVILFRTATGELKALTATCTHLACTVQYRTDAQRHLVRLPQRRLRRQRHQHLRASSEAADAARGRRAGRQGCHPARLTAPLPRASPRPPGSRTGSDGTGSPIWRRRRKSRSTGTRSSTTSAGWPSSSSSCRWPPGFCCFSTTAQARPRPSRASSTSWPRSRSDG